MNGKIAGIAGVFMLGGIVALLGTQHATAQFMNQQIENYVKQQNPKSNIHIDYKILNKNILAQQGELTFVYIDRDVKKKGKLKTYTTILPLYTSTRFEADNELTKEFFAAKVEKVTINGARNPVVLKAIDISRNVDVEKDQERV